MEWAPAQVAGTLDELTCLQEERKKLTFLKDMRHADKIPIFGAR